MSDDKGCNPVVAHPSERTGNGIAPVQGAFALLIALKIEPAREALRHRAIQLADVSTVRMIDRGALQIGF
jgi:hypothetical protein